MRSKPNEIEVELSPPQISIWLACSAHPKVNASYNISHVFTVTGGCLDIDQLTSAVTLAVQQHPVLAATVGTSDSKPTLNYSTVFPFARLCGQVVVISKGVSIEQFCSEPFALRDELMFRVGVKRTHDGSETIAFVFHHIVFDRESFGAFFTTFQNEYVNPREFNVESTQANWYDSAANQISTDSHQKKLDLEYWSQILSDIAKPVDVSFLRPIDCGRSYLAGNYRTSLDKEVVGRFKEEAKKRNVTLFSAVCAVTAIAINKRSRQNTFALAIPVSTRLRKDTVGLHINTLVLKPLIESKMSMAELARELGTQVWGCLEHRNIALYELVEKLDSWVDRSVSEIFDLSLNFNFKSGDQYNLGELVLRKLPSRAYFGKNLLNVEVLVSDDEIQIDYVYDTGQVDRGLLEQFSGYHKYLFARFVESSESPISSLPTETPQTRSTVAERWSANKHDYLYQRIDQFVDQFALETPYAIAVSSSVQKYSYAQLVSEAEALADLIRIRCRGDEAYIGVYMTRSPSLIVTLLAIIKSGRAYLALDPSYPEERIRYMLNDSGVRLVVVSTDLGSGELFGAIDVIEFTAQHDEQLVSNTKFDEIGTKRAIPSSDLAYLMYTSGSTGLPKGVRVSHRGVVSLLANSGPLGFTRKTVSLFTSTLGFDSSTLEIWGPLIHGGSVVLYEGNAKNPNELARCIRQSNINWVFFPAGMCQIISRCEADCLSKVDVMISGGDVVSADAIKILQRTSPECTYLNGYGPTENTVISTIYQYPDEFSGKHSPIGQAARNRQVYILDSHMNLLPPGVEGELYVGGDGIADGYHNRIELTAEKFVLNPFANNREKLFKTGDQARFLDDGTIQFIGRIDNQVQIRGLRVELGEVEYHLQQYASIEQAVVLARPRFDDLRLVAFLVMADSAVTVREVRQRLKRFLPSPMVPHEFCFVNEIPYTANGKIDRQHLLETSLADSQSPLGDLGVGATPVQKFLLGTWQELLGVREIDIDDDFFELGGNSLLAMKICPLVNDEYANRLEIGDVFSNPTIRLLSQVLEEKATKNSYTEKIEKTRISSTLPATHAQKRFWLLQNHDSKSYVYNVPVLVSLRGSLDLDCLKSAVQGMVSGHEGLRLSVTLHDEELKQTIKKEIQCDIGVHSLIETGESPTQDFLHHASRPFVLNKSPLFRVDIWSDHENKHWIMLNFHHLLIDGISVNMLIQELAERYSARLAGRSYIDTSCVTRYRECVADPVFWSDNIVDNQHYDYWRQYLESAPARLTLPFETRVVKTLSYVGDSYPIQLGEVLTAQIQALAKTLQASLFSVTCSLFQVMLSRYTHEQDIVVGYPTTGRVTDKSVDIVGCFVNTLPLRAKLTRYIRFAELVKLNMKSVSKGQYHQCVPIEKIAETAGVKSNNEYSALFQHMFSFNEALQTTYSMGESEASLVHLPMGIAKYDLTLSLHIESNEIVGEIEFNTEKFEPKRVALMVEHYRKLAEIAVSSTVSPVHHWSYLCEQDETALRRMHKNTTSGSTSPVSFLDFIFKNVCIGNNSVALHYGQSRCSYADLARRVSEAQANLSILGGYKNRNILVYMERSSEQIAIILAAMSLGGVVVPVDVDLPPNSLLHISNETQPALVITTSALKGRFDTWKQQITYCDLWKVGMSPRSDIEVIPTDLALILFTSGTTGKPKGIQITHRALANRLDWVQKQYPLTPEDRVLHKTSISFDVALSEILWPLFAGSQIVIANTNGEKNPHYLSEVIYEKGVTVVDFVPSVLSILLEQDAWKKCQSLRLIFCGGEALPEKLIEQISATKDARLVNAYGPTETTIDVSFWECIKKSAGGAVLIGKPMQNTTFRILDALGQKVPVGVSGELYISGDSLSSGYVNLPQLTQEKFMQLPDGEGCTQRFYRTGDRVSFDENGDLRFLGREDEQHKVNGVRIELNYILHLLGNVASVSDAAVHIRESSSGNKQVVAYVVSGDSSSSENVIRESLMKDLPNYSLPSKIVLLDVIPRLANMKIDFDALCSVDYNTHELRCVVEPKSIKQLLLADIWKDVLGLDSIGIHDDFFELGGHSMHAMIVITKIQRQFKREMELQEFYQNSTVHKLSETISVDQNGA